MAKDRKRNSLELLKKQYEVSKALDADCSQGLKRRFWGKPSWAQRKGERDPIRSEKKGAGSFGGKYLENLEL